MKKAQADTSWTMNNMVLIILALILMLVVGYLIARTLKNAGMF